MLGGLTSRALGYLIILLLLLPLPYTTHSKGILLDKYHPYRVAQYNKQTQTLKEKTLESVLLGPEALSLHFSYVSPACMHDSYLARRLYSTTAQRDGERDRWRKQERIRVDHETRGTVAVAVTVTATIIATVLAISHNPCYSIIIEKNRKKQIK